MATTRTKTGSKSPASAASRVRYIHYDRPLPYPADVEVWNSKLHKNDEKIGVLLHFVGNGFNTPEAVVGDNPRDARFLELFGLKSPTQQPRQSIDGFKDDLSRVCFAGTAAACDWEISPVSVSAMTRLFKNTFIEWVSTLSMGSNAREAVEAPESASTIEVLFDLEQRLVLSSSVEDAQTVSAAWQFLYAEVDSTHAKGDNSPFAVYPFACEVFDSRHVVYRNSTTEDGFGLMTWSTAKKTVTPWINHMGCHDEDYSTVVFEGHRSETALRSGGRWSRVSNVENVRGNTNSQAAVCAGSLVINGHLGRAHQNIYMAELSAVPRYSADWANGATPDEWKVVSEDARDSGCAIVWVPRSAFQQNVLDFVDFLNIHPMTSSAGFLKEPVVAGLEYLKHKDVVHALNGMVVELPAEQPSEDDERLTDSLVLGDLVSRINVDPRYLPDEIEALLSREVRYRLRSHSELIRPGLAAWEKTVKGWAESGRAVNRSLLNLVMPSDVAEGLDINPGRSARQTAEDRKSTLTSIEAMTPVVRGIYEAFCAIPEDVRQTLRKMIGKAADAAKFFSIVDCGAAHPTVLAACMQLRSSHFDWIKPRAGRESEVSPVSFMYPHIYHQLPSIADFARVSSRNELSAPNAAWSFDDIESLAVYLEELKDEAIKEGFSVENSPVFTGFLDMVKRRVSQRKGQSQDNSSPDMPTLRAGMRQTSIDIFRAGAVAPTTSDDDDCDTELDRDEDEDRDPDDDSRLEAKVAAKAKAKVERTMVSVLGMGRLPRMLHASNYHGLPGYAVAGLVTRHVVVGSTVVVAESRHETSARQSGGTLGQTRPGALLSGTVQSLAGIASLFETMAWDLDHPSEMGQSKTDQWVQERLNGGRAVEAAIIDYFIGFTEDRFHEHLIGEFKPSGGSRGSGAKINFGDLFDIDGNDEYAPSAIMMSSVHGDTRGLSLFTKIAGAFGYSSGLELLMDTRVRTAMRGAMCVPEDVPGAGISWWGSHTRPISNEGLMHLALADEGNIGCAESVASLFNASESVFDFVRNQLNLTVSPRVQKRVGSKNPFAEGNDRLAWAIDLARLTCEPDAALRAVFRGMVDAAKLLTIIVKPNDVTLAGCTIAAGVLHSFYGERNHREVRPLSDDATDTSYRIGTGQVQHDVDDESAESDDESEASDAENDNEEDEEDEEPTPRRRATRKMIEALGAEELPKTVLRASIADIDHKGDLSIENDSAALIDASVIEGVFNAFLRGGRSKAAVSADASGVRSAWLSSTLDSTAKLSQSALTAWETVCFVLSYSGKAQLVNLDGLSKEPHTQLGSVLVMKADDVSAFLDGLHRSQAKDVADSSTIDVQRQSNEIVVRALEAVASTVESIEEINSAKARLERLIREAQNTQKAMVQNLREAGLELNALKESIKGPAPEAVLSAIQHLPFIGAVSVSEDVSRIVFDTKWTEVSWMDQFNAWMVCRRIQEAVEAEVKLSISIADLFNLVDEQSLFGSRSYYPRHGGMLPPDLKIAGMAASLRAAGRMLDAFMGESDEFKYSRRVFVSRLLNEDGRVRGSRFLRTIVDEDESGRTDVNPDDFPKSMKETIDFLACTLEEVARNADRASEAMSDESRLLLSFSVIYDGPDRRIVRPEQVFKLVEWTKDIECDEGTTLVNDLMELSRSLWTSLSWNKLLSVLKVFLDLPTTDDEVAWAKKAQKFAQCVQNGSGRGGIRLTEVCHDIICAVGLFTGGYRSWKRTYPPRRVTIERIVKKGHYSQENVNVTVRAHHLVRPALEGMAEFDLYSDMGLKFTDEERAVFEAQRPFNIGASASLDWGVVKGQDLNQFAARVNEVCSQLAESSTRNSESRVATDAVAADRFRRRFLSGYASLLIARQLVKKVRDEGAPFNVTDTGKCKEFRIEDTVNPVEVDIAAYVSLRTQQVIAPHITASGSVCGGSFSSVVEELTARIKKDADAAAALAVEINNFICSGSDTVTGLPAIMVTSRGRPSIVIDGASVESENLI